ncbi:Alpha/Beta hydrolase protein [Xylariaceae sp. FL1651]|nr:Alpha/Beta hydrolase protein [Xylariaceae sp. FL1651]
MLQSVLSFLGLALQTRAMVFVPELTGPYKVGTTVLELVDFARTDPFAPTPQPRDLVVSLFYPTESPSKQACNCTLAPQFPPKTAALIDNMFNVSGVAESITTRSCVDSPLSRPDLPLLLFGPGLGTSRLFYSDLAEEIASYGWNVVTVDPPYDSIVVEYPDGRTVLPSDSPTVANATIEEFVYARVADLIFVLDSLANSSVVSRIPGLGGVSSYQKSGSHEHAKPKLRTDKIGVFGHSLGGATALQLLKNDTRFHVGANLDGAAEGSVVQEGTDSPFLFFGRPDHNRHTDDTWAEAWQNLRGFKREYAVNGTQHGAYSDLPIFRDILGDQFPSELSGGLGTIKGTRIMEIETAFLKALFDRFLKGHGGQLLDGKGLDHWPEVALVE